MPRTQMCAAGGMTDMANVVVAGSAVFGGNITDNVTYFKTIMNEYES